MFAISCLRVQETTSTSIWHLDTLQIDSAAHKRTYIHMDLPRLPFLTLFNSHRVSKTLSFLKKTFLLWILWAFFSCLTFALCALQTCQTHTNRLWMSKLNRSVDKFPQHASQSCGHFLFMLLIIMNNFLQVVPLSEGKMQEAEYKWAGKDKMSTVLYPTIF